ncbi:hypothetical protein [Oceanobacillus halophilus]|uniref:Uncharacterized protein n=1 Tax=Oceanobacillus halophilus TaxID=930130 RepID=A0A494ZRL9_9BACI|nr:hypothetical protein [Oceanobacillus halophilus]RKQ28434.1 hypothetical protein D8M06_18850 [Oceanobacillus halophilus]
MRDWFYEHLYIFYTFIIILSIINYFWVQDWLNYIIGVLAIPMLIVSFYTATKLFKILGTAFILVGFSMYIYVGLPLYNIPLFLTSNMSLLGFLIVLPWINTVVHVGRYDKQINRLMVENVEDLGALYVKSTITTYILMMFLNLSAVILSQDVLQKNMKHMSKTVRDVFISKTTIRAFALALIWSPMEVIVAITIEATGVNYLRLLPWLILVSVLTLSIDIIVGRQRFKSIPFNHQSRNSNISLIGILRKIIQLFIALVLFLTTILIVSNLFNLNFIITVTLVIIPFSIIWAFLIKKMQSFKLLGYKLWKRQTNNMQNFIVLFTTLAFFSNSLNATPFLEVVQKPFMLFTENPLVVFLFIMLTYFFMALLGIHPIGVTGVLVEVLAPIFTIFNPLSIAIVLIVSALATSGSSSYGVAVTLTAMNTHQNPYKITLRNLIFTFTFGFIGIFVAMLIL